MRWVCGVVAATAASMSILASCSVGALHHGQVTGPVGLLTFHRYGLEFHYPTAWPAKERPAQSTSQSMLITYLTPSRLHTPCREWTSPLGGGGSCRGLAIKVLPPRGVFVMWWLVGLPVGLPVAGSRQIIGGHLAVVSMHDPGACAGLGAQASIVAAILKTQANWYVMTACLRGPGLPGAETAVRAMLHSVHLGHFPGT